MRTYTLNVAGVTRELPLCEVNDRLCVAAFVMFSDVELTVACASALLKKLPDFDVILTAESKGIPLAYEMSRQSGKKYYVAKRSIKLYMTDPISVDVRSGMSPAPQKLYLSLEDAICIRGKKVVIIDDIISAGESLRALETLVDEAGGNTAAKAAVLAEGMAADRKDIVFLEKLPLFPQ